METYPLWRIFVGGYGRVVGAVDAEHGGADAGGGDEVVAGEVGDEVGVCEAATSPGHFFNIFLLFFGFFFIFGGNEGKDEVERLVLDRTVG